MSRLLELLGYVLIVAIVVNFIRGHHSHWEAGRYGMPRTLMSADGGHYRDGSEMDAVTLSLVHADIEEEVKLGMVSGFVMLLTYVMVENVRLYRRKLGDQRLNDRQMGK